MLFGHARRGVTTTEYPYVDGDATLQIDDVEPKAYHLYISLIDSPVKIPCGCRQSMNSTLAIPFPLTVERETVLLRMLVGCMAMPISSPVPSVERAIDAQQCNYSAPLTRKCQKSALIISKLVLGLFPNSC